MTEKKYNELLERITADLEKKWYLIPKKSTPIPKNHSRPIDPTFIEHVATIVCREYGATIDDVRSKSRVQDHVRPRHLTCWMVRELVGTRILLGDIGKFLNIDHTSVTFAIKRVKESMSVERKFRQDVEQLKLKVESLIGNQ